MASAYTPEQIAQYEQYVELPEKYRQASNPKLDIAYLTALHVHQIAKVPYENLALHYSTHHSVTLKPQFLFDKIVTDARGRGGYCMENSLFFNHVLRAVGFQVYTAGVRIRPRVGGIPGGDYTGWVHIVNIITLPTGEKYMCDVGFGGDGATKPLPMIPGHISHNLGTQEVRLIHSTIPEQIDQTKPVWIYQYRNNPLQEWNSFFCFPEFEFTEADFVIISYYTSTSPYEANFQTKTVLIVRFLRGAGENGEERIVGKVMLVNGEVKRNDGGKTRVLLHCTGEDERVRVFREEFGIYLTEEEVEGVKGRNVELTGLPN